MIKINKTLLIEMIAGGFVVTQKHKTLDLHLYNYTRKCTYEKMWNEITLMCRGLILDGDYKIVSLPIGKFFNYEEYGPERIESELRGKKYHVYEKKDGSCGVLWEYEGNYGIATRGSFESEQAIWATKYLNENYLDKVKELDTDNFSYIYEIIYPENRIVIDYNGMKDLVFLARMNKNSGVDEMLEDNITEIMAPFKVTDRYKELENLSFEELQALNLHNKEGFVLHGENKRIKVKFADYCRLHSIITNITARDIWRTLSQGKSVDEILDNVPDEFDEWVRNKVHELKSGFKEIENNAIFAYENVIKELPVSFHDKEFALKNFEINKDKFLRATTFSIHKNYDISESIWKRLYPAHEKPFMNITEDID